MGKGKRKRGGDSFEVVPSGFQTGARGGGRAGGGGRGGRSGGQHNTLRQAFTGAMSKADEIWFRKCGHGERLYASYYRGQRHVIPLAEWDAFEATIGRKLPVTFRLRGADSNEVCDQLERQLHALGTVRPVPWAPASARIWQAAAELDKRTVAKASSEGGEALGGILADGVAKGVLNRQEVVSMLPVLALQVPAGASVLDMCASPGSKTMQLLEAVSARGASGGMVVANDAHPKRVAALIAAIERHNRPSAEHRRLVVTCHRGEAFPMPARPFRKPTGSTDAPVGFDCVLADVPCSGDGTIRKDPTVMPRWTPAVGTQLHGAQLAIAWRGLELLRVGGLMAYSTCSLNPMEVDSVHRSRS